MPEHIRSLIVILLLASVIFVIAHRTASEILEAHNYTRRRNLWIALTIVAFVSGSFWIYIFIASILIIYTKRNDPQPLSLFLFTLLVLPMATIQIPGMGIINYVFELSHARLLSLVLLLPMFLALRKQKEITPFGKLAADKAIFAYLALTIILSSRGNNYADASLTSTLRYCFYMFTDVFLPYYVASRSLRNLQNFRDALTSFLIASLVVAILAIFESYKSWLLYSSVTRVLQLENAMTGYLGRGDLLRSIVTTGQPIVLGYLMVVAMGLYLFIQRSIQQQVIRYLGMALLIVALIASVSRGPWVGAIALVIFFIVTGRYIIRRLILLGLVSVIALSAASMLPGGEKIINMMPFVGSTGKENVDYRKDLLSNSMVVIQRHPWFGSIDYLKTPEMEVMRQGEGIIDIVNSYIRVALEQGITGLILFVWFFALALIAIFKSMILIKDKGSEEHLLGQSLLATLLAILVTIFTVSSISIIPIVYWIVSGLGIGYSQMILRNTKLKTASTD